MNWHELASIFDEEIQRSTPISLLLPDSFCKFQLGQMFLFGGVASSATLYYCICQLSKTTRTCGVYCHNNQQILSQNGLLLFESEWSSLEASLCLWMRGADLDCDNEHVTLPDDWKNAFRVADEGRQMKHGICVSS